MIIDEKGKLFGKISIIDFAIVAIVILGILGGIFVSFHSADSDNKKELTKVEEGDTLNEFLIEYSLKNVRDITRDALAVGDEVFSVNSGKLIGVIEKIESTPLQEIVSGLDGKMVYADIPEKYHVTLYVKVWGKETETGCFTQYNHHMSYGDTVPVKTVKVQTSPVVKEITLIPGNTKTASDPDGDLMSSGVVKNEKTTPEKTEEDTVAESVVEKENNEK